MNKKYEISVWRDVYSSTLNRWTEEKLIVIGSDTMTSQSRAREPKLVSNINGTNTFSFIMYYSYIDVETGEQVKNPFIPFLVNERKLKVYWKNEWYDLLIKNIEEDSQNHTFTYTCEDQYLTELSRSGFNLEFAYELENNIGTPEELVNETIKGTDWQFNSELSDIIYQTIEEPVYEVTVQSNFSARKEPELSETTIIAEQPALIFYSCAPSATEDALKSLLQFWYTADNIWQQDDNDMLVLNGNCYEVEVTWEVEDSIARAQVNNQTIFEINFNEGLSNKYRAKRYVNSQKTEFSTVVNRYVDVYQDQTGHKYYGYETTEFNNALAVVNLITNSQNFTNSQGWIKPEEDKNGLVPRISPPFNKDTVVSDYEAKSYLNFSSGVTYENSGLQNNRSYIKNGFVEGETYIFRYKCIADENERPTTNIKYIAGDLEPIINNYFSTEFVKYEDDWNEWILTCITPCAYDDLLKIGTRPILQVRNNGDTTCWVEEIQFFKEVFGERIIGGEPQEVRINPNEMDIQSVANVVYKFFDSETEAATATEVEYINGNGLTPVTNNFQRYGSIEASESNRFNILQSIAEAFECWVRFKIVHDDEGYMEYDEGDKPKKYIYLKSEIGQDSGLTFVYGIDLQGVKRGLKSSSISTKTIVRSNNNKFGKNGFCTIARSQQNYPRENVIYNFDYYIQQGLLDKETIQNDLYGANEYYDTLHKNNVKYMDNLNIIVNKNTELTRQIAQQKVYNQYLTSAQEERAAVESDIIKLSGTTSWEAAMEYAKSHLDDRKIQTLINDHTQIKNTIVLYSELEYGIETSIAQIQATIDELETEQDTIIDTLTEVDEAFQKKYARFIQEGTWSSEDYYNDDLYYLDAVQVAYQSSRPQITYNINVLRVSDTIDFSSKVFNLADIAYIQDTEYFGYKDKFTPYKEKVFLSEITSYFDSPERDQLKVQNYLTQFDDLFNRITAATQTLEFSQGKYAKAASIMESNGTIKASVIQDTFNSNADLVYGAQNESATIDNTGITVTSNEDGSKLVKVTSGGVFVSNDGGETWKNAIRGDGISTDLLTAGRVNTNEITIYNLDQPSFRWDAIGINAYKVNENGMTDTQRFVRFDQYGMYGIDWENSEEPFEPTKIEDIYDNAKFGMTWERFFMKNKNATGSIEVSNNNDILVEAAKHDINGDYIIEDDTDKNNPKYKMVERVKIGSLGDGQYGMVIKNNDENVVFRCDGNEAKIAGWTINEGYLESQTKVNQHIRISADGNIGCYGNENAYSQKEDAYPVKTIVGFTATSLKNGQAFTVSPNDTIYMFASTVGKLTTSMEVAGPYDSDYNEPDSTDKSLSPNPSEIIIFAIRKGADEYESYQLVTNEEQTIKWYISYNTTHSSRRIDTTQPESDNNIMTTYVYHYNLYLQINNEVVLQPINDRITSEKVDRYVPESSNAWVIDNNGDAIFHNIFADGGKIAGWYIDGERIYQTWDGTPNIGENGSNIKSELNSSGAKKDEVDYSIITDAINAAMANIGGVLMSGGLINGYNIAKVMSKANSAASKADEAYRIAVNASSAASQAQTSINTLQTRFNSHKHNVINLTEYVDRDSEHFYAFDRSSGNKTSSPS